LKKSIEMDDNCIVGNYNLGILMLNSKNNVEAALKAFLKVLKVEPTHVEACRYIARIYGVEKGDLGVAEKYYKIALKNAKDGKATAEIQREMAELTNSSGGGAEKRKSRGSRG
jgi:tetratricopeptide (TPR) repeat protein